MSLPQKTKHRSALLFCLGCCAGILAFVLINGTGSLDVTNDAWILSGYAEKDVLQHYTGWLYYRQSALTFPLGMASGINSPYGCAVSFTDSVPVAAIFFRLLSPLLPETFQYFGIVNLLFYALQGGFAALLLGLFAESVPAVLCGSALFVCAPVLLERSFRHTALAAQFLITAGLYYYFKNRRQGFRYRIGWLVLAALATSIHPYFLPMVFALLFADLVCEAAGTRRVLKPLGFLLAAFAVVGVTGYSIGLFSSGGAGIATGYGHFCMNLNSLFDPVSSGGFVWSNLLKQRPQGLGTADGFNYLGLGVLVCALPCAVWGIVRRGKDGCLALAKRHWPLLFVCACLTVFAVSTTLIYCNLVIVRITLPDALQALASTFRSSGRMFWPVYYLVFTAVFEELNALRPPKAKALGTVLLAALLAVQLWDMSPALARKHSYFDETQRQDFTYPLQSAAWDALAGQFTTVESLDLSLYQAVYPAYYAASNGMAGTDGWAARYDVARRQTDLKALIAALEDGQYEADKLYITSDYDLFLRLARSCGDAAIPLQLDDYWYVLVPAAADVDLPAADENTRYYPDLLLKLADYSDDDWSYGVKNTDCTAALFRYDETTQAQLDAAAYITDEGGNKYRILGREYPFDGYIALTLEIEDANALNGQHLGTK